MSKISVTANWDELPCIDACDIISRVPKTINIKIDPQDQTKMLIEDNDLFPLNKAVEKFGITIHPLSCKD